MLLLQKLISKLTGNGQANGVKGQKEPLITLTQESVICSYPSRKKTEKVSWSRVSRVDVLTTDEGPYVCDVFILIADEEGGVSIPQDREECKAVLDKIFTLPGFDFEEFTTAMSSTENKMFPV